MQPNDHRGRGVLWFLVLAFGLAWTVEIGMYLGGIRMNSAAFVAGLALVMFTPGLAAFIVRKFITREGFADAGLSIGVKKYYLMAWFGFPLLTAASLGVALLLGFAQWDASLAGMAQFVEGQELENLPASPAVIILAQTAFAVFLAPWLNLIPAFGEEFGWRGYLQVRLAHLGRLRSYLYTGLVWGVWHAPVILQGYNYPGHHNLGVLAMVVFTVLLAVILGWLRDASGSVWVAALGHGALNGTVGLVFLVSRGDNSLLGPALTGLSGWIVLMVFILWLARRGALTAEGSR